MIIGIVGPMRSGKTLVATMIGYNYACRGRRVYANYSIKKCRLITPKELHKAIKEGDTEWLRDSVVILDEVQTIIDSRASASEWSRLVSYYILQTGKLRSVLIWTSQHYGQADKRLRIHTDTLVEVRRGTVEDGVIVEAPFGREVEPYVVIATENVQRDDGRQMVYSHVGVKVVDPRPAYSLYDTGEAIFPTSHADGEPPRAGGSLSTAKAGHSSTRKTPARRAYRRR